MARQDGRNQPALPEPQPLLPRDLQPRHREEQKGAGIAPFWGALPHPALNTHLNSSRGSSKRRSPGRPPSRMGSLGRQFGPSEVSAWIRQENTPAVLPPPSRLLFIVGFEAQGREQGPAHLVRNKTQPKIQSQDYQPRRGIAEPPAHSLVGARRAATAEMEGMSPGRRSQEAAAVAPARLGREQRATGNRLPKRPPKCHQLSVPHRTRYHSWAAKTHLKSPLKRARQQDSRCTSFH